jgi:hypothetical protein
MLSKSVRRIPVLIMMTCIASAAFLRVTHGAEDDAATREAAIRKAYADKLKETYNPDDLAAHYNLAILYRRKGLKQKAEAESALYTMKRIDPGAPTYSLDYLRKHPEISTESVPWHVHNEISNTPPASGGGTQ